MKGKEVLSLVGVGLLSVLALSMFIGASFIDEVTAAGADKDATRSLEQRMKDTLLPSQEVDEADPSLSYFFVLGWQLIPRDSDLEYTHTRGGCLIVTSGARPYLTFPVTIPEGSIIKYLRIYYHDSNIDHSMHVYLNRYEVGYTFVEVTSLDSVDGEETLVSAELNEVVDGTEHQYSIDAEWLEPGETLRICGVRVAYYDPFHARFIPLVQQDQVSGLKPDTR